MIPFDCSVQIRNREHHEDDQRDDFLDRLQLRRTVDGVADAVAGNLQAVLEERDAPAYENDDPQRTIGEFQVAVPREGHKDVRSDQQGYRCDVGEHGSLRRLNQSTSRSRKRDSYRRLSMRSFWSGMNSTPSSSAVVRMMRTSMPITVS